MNFMFCCGLVHEAKGATCCMVCGTLCGEGHAVREARCAEKDMCGIREIMCAVGHDVRGEMCSGVGKLCRMEHVVVGWDMWCEF